MPKKTKTKVTAAKGSVRIVAEKLARAHKANDPATTQILWYADAKNKEVRLVEVSGSVDSAGGPMPVRLSKDPKRGITYESVIILLSIAEGKKLLAGKLNLPDGWDPKKYIDITP